MSAKCGMQTCIKKMKLYYEALEFHKLLKNNLLRQAAKFANK